MGRTTEHYAAIKRNQVSLYVCQVWEGGGMGTENFLLHTILYCLALLWLSSITYVIFKIEGKETGREGGREEEDRTGQKNAY